MRRRSLILTLCCCAVVLVSCDDDTAVTPEPEVSCVDATVETPGIALNVKLTGDCAFVDDWDDGIQIIDVSVPHSPNMVSSLDVGRPSDFLVLNDTLYVSGYGVKVFDVSAPESPRLVGTLGDVRTVGDEEPVIYGRGIALAGSYLYTGAKLDVTAGVFGFHVIDIANPTQPAISGGVEMVSIPGSMRASDGYLYVAGVEGLSVFDLSNPMLPARVATVDMPGGNYCLQVVDGFAYVAAEDFGLLVIDVRQPESPDFLSLEAGGSVSDFTVHDGFAYVATAENAIRVIDIRDPELPVALGFIETPFRPYGVAVSDDHLLVTHGSLSLLNRECSQDPTW